MRGFPLWYCGLLSGLAESPRSENSNVIRPGILRHIIKLRTAPTALEEFQDLAHVLFDAVPDGFKYLLEDCIYKENKKYMMLKAHFNPAAIQRKEGSESILVSLFAPKDKNSNNSQDFGYSAGGSAEFQDNSPSQEYNSNIPF